MKVKLMEQVQPPSAPDSLHNEATQHPASNGSIATASPNPPLPATPSSFSATGDPDDEQRILVPESGTLSILTLENKESLGQLLIGSESHLSPNSCSVETSTTDSGVSNPSSLMSDFTGHLSNDVLNLPPDHTHITDLEINADGIGCYNASLPDEENLGTPELSSKEVVSEEPSVFGPEVATSSGGLEGDGSSQGVVRGTGLELGEFCFLVLVSFCRGCMA